MAPAALRHCHHVTGNYDYLLQVDVADLPAYEFFHANRLATLPSVAAVTSYVTMKTFSAEPRDGPVQPTVQPWPWARAEDSSLWAGG